MDNKITLSILAQMLSDRTGRSRKECEDLLRSFFQTISATLAAGEPVKVRGFGTFKISQVDARMSVDISSGEDYEIPAHNRIVFLPAKELAGAVNAPFEMFETIELSDALTDAELQGAEAAAVPADPAELAEPEEVAIPEEAATPQDEVITRQPEAPVEDAGEEIGNVDEENENENEDVDEENENEEEVVQPTSSRFGRGFIWGMIAAVAIIIAGIGALYYLNDDFNHHFNSMIGRQKEAPHEEGSVSRVADDDAVAAALPEGSVAEATDIAEAETGLADMVEDTPPTPQPTEDNTVPTKPSDQPVYDTITKTSGLGAMARKHYGNYHFWPYIYKENEKILGHPDRIRPDTRVVIPPLSKYGVDPKNPADLAKAKRLDAEIYARYKKKK